MNSDYNKLLADIRLLDSKIEDLTKERNNYGNMIFVANKMLKNQFLLLLIGIGVSLISGGILDLSNFFVSAIVNGMYGVVMTTILVLVSTVYFGIAKIIYTNKFKKVDTELLMSEDLKYEYEKELVKIRKREMTVKDSKNNTISFCESDNLVIETLLFKKTNENEKTKKRILKKKK